MGCSPLKKFKRSKVCQSNNSVSIFKHCRCHLPLPKKKSQAKSCGSTPTFPIVHFSLGISLFTALLPLWDIL